MTNRNDPISMILASGKPATWGLIFGLGAFYVASWATKAPFFTVGLALIHTSHVAMTPWSLLTYPFASSGVGSALIWELLLLYWLYWVGGDTERDIGPWGLLILFFAATVIGAGCVLLAWKAFGHAGMLDTSLIPIGAVTVAWGTRNPTANVRMYGIIPLSGKIIAIIDTALVLFSVGDGFIPAGVLALVPLGLAWAYAADKLPGLAYGRNPQLNAARRPSKHNARSKVGKSTERRGEDYFDDVNRRMKEREERERLRKLFESSINEDNDK